MTAIPSYGAEQLMELLGILPDVDSVELKLSIPRAEHRGAVARLGIDALQAQIRQVAFIDTPDLRLSDAGLVVRARRTQGRAGDITVKLRPMLPGDVPERLRGLDGFKVEIDASPAGFTCSCSLTAEVSDRKVKALMHDVSGITRLPKLLSGHQRSILADHLPAGVTTSDLSLLGPQTLLKAKFAPKGGPRKMVAELWFLPDGSRLLELSTKTTPAEAFQAAAATKAFLVGRGVHLGAPQEAKTGRSLAVLAGDLATITAGL
jgi:hypothetical protein